MNNISEIVVRYVALDDGSRQSPKILLRTMNLNRRRVLKQYDLDSNVNGGAYYIRYKCLYRIKRSIV